MTAKPITVCISGGGSNLKALITAIQNGQINASITAVIADRDCSGKQHAFDAGIPFTLIDRKLPPPTFAAELAAAIPAGTGLIILAGFLSIVPENITDAYRGRIINLHPSLLPKYGGAGMYGINVHRAVIAAGETESGCTVHYADGGIDTGRIIAQARVPVLPDDTPETLQQRIAPEEHRLLIATVAQLAADETLH